MALIRHLEHWAPQHNRPMDILERVWERATKLMDELEHLSYKERLREPGLLNLEKKYSQGFYECR